jgi:transcriptional regulator with XRE-family HTH domain/tetratricopeptide (TPR) repeat protein
MSDGSARAGAAKRRALAERRKAVGLTQEQLAELLRVERTTIVRWERGETRPLPGLQPRLAKALGVSADRLEELLADDGTPASPDGRAAAVPRQLPAAVADFTGRAAQLEALTRMLDEAGADAPGTVVISAIGGTAGVGKTALALHWAHQVAHRFGDGHLHANLRGFHPSGSPATAEAAVRGFLDALGVPPERIPTSPEAQAGLYRGLLADRKMLIVLDNVRDEEQVRPLLPASPGSLVLVTSRSQLDGLAARDGARLLTVDVLSHGEAVRLLTARLGIYRVAAEPAAVDRIASLCACLPLALAVAAARAAARPGFPLAALADELADVAGRLDALDAGDPTTSVRAVFSWSYRQLGAEWARMFRLLSLHPGPDISVPAAASLAGRTQPRARRQLRELARAHLIAEHTLGRFSFHDLLRTYAGEQAHHTDSEPERQAAVGRVLGHYLHTAARAAYLLDPAKEPVVLAEPSPGVTAEQLANRGEALAWFEDEHQVLLAAFSLAAGSGFDSQAWQLAWAMEFFLRNRGHWQESAATLRAALAAATRLGDTTAQAISSRLLALACKDLGDFDQARCHIANSLALYRQLGNRLGEAKGRQSLAHLADRQGRYAEALGHAEQALRLYQAAGDRMGEARMPQNIGWIYAQLGDYARARVLCKRTLALTAELGLRDVEAHAWDSLGFAEYHLGNLAEAANCYQRALPLYQEVGDLAEEAITLTHLGDTQHAARQQDQARETWQQALAIFEHLQHADADLVRAKLASMNDHPAASPST